MFMGWFQETEGQRKRWEDLPGVPERLDVLSVTLQVAGEMLLDPPSVLLLLSVLLPLSL